jgi:flavin reductase (DIM6/NTAB) family NADH-FMN oxidoreductase RutF
MSVAPEALRQTMRQWASGVTVVTCANTEHRAGLTVNAFSSVSLDPALILICLQKGTSTLGLIQEARIFAVSILRENHAHLSAQFAGFTQLPDGADRFYNVPITTHVTGAPILTEAGAWMDCRVHSITDIGSTSIIIGEVVGTGYQENVTPLIYHNRTYFKLIPQA